MKLVVTLGLLTVSAWVGPLRARQSELDLASMARIDSIFSRFTVPGSPGCAVAVIRDGRVVHAKGYGLASIELGVPITPATVFDIGSTSKQFTAAAIVLLAQEKKLSLDDGVRRWVPELPESAGRVTIRHLLHHTSGIRDYIDLLFASGVPKQAVTGEREALEVLARQRALNFEPGAQYAYSNSGYFLLGVIVSRAGGKNLRAFAAERIFAPLGMTHSLFLDDHTEVVAGKASSYAPRASGGFALSPANWEQVGDGAVQTTVEDLLKWDANFYSGTVGGRAMLDLLQTRGRLSNDSVIAYALGLGVDTYRGLSRVSHGGAWAGFRADLMRFPEQRTSIACLCNHAASNPSLLARRVADVVLVGSLARPAPPPPTPPSPPPDTIAKRTPLPPAAYVGRYRSDELLTDWRLTVRDDTLRLRTGLIEGPVTGVAGDRFRSEVGALTFERNADGAITGVRVFNRGVRGLRLARVSGEP